MDRKPLSREDKVWTVVGFIAICAAVVGIVSIHPTSFALGPLGAIAAHNNPAPPLLAHGSGG